MTEETRHYYTKDEMAKSGYYPISGWAGYYMNENKAIYHMESGEPEYVERDGKIYAMMGPRHNLDEVDIDTLQFSKTHNRAVHKQRYIENHVCGDLEDYTHIIAFNDVFVGPELDVVTGHGRLHHIVSVDSAGEMRYRFLDGNGKQAVLTARQLLKKNNQGR